MNKLAFGALLVGLVACGGNGKKPPKIVDSGTTADAAGSGEQCNVLTQMGCNAGEKCSWIIDQRMPQELGHVGCAPDGTIDVGGACMYGDGSSTATGPDNCKKGLACLSGVCKTICDQNGGAPMCDAQHSCQVYDGFLGPSGMEAGGVCDPLCNPLDDNDFDGSGTRLTKIGSACGSDPTVGCYGFWNGDAPTHFSCADEGDPTAVQASPCIYHAMPAPTCATSGGTPYLNGCAAGYMPMFFEKEGSTTTQCEAFCQPADCSKDGGCTNNAEIGSGAHQCSAADAEGTFGNVNTAPTSCVYGWFWAAIQQQGSGAWPNPNNILNTTGFCLQRSVFDLTDAAGSATTTPWPECKDMVAVGSDNCVGGSAHDPTQCFGAAWGCVSTTTAGITTAFAQDAVKRVRQHMAVNIRLPYHQSLIVPPHVH